MGPLLHRLRDADALPTDMDRAVAHYSTVLLQSHARIITPGPWRWDGRALVPATPRPDTHHVHTILTDDSGGFGFLGSVHAATSAELDADHQLIAAAPLLLAALIDLRSACHIALSGSTVMRAADAALAAAMPHAAQEAAPC